jgi:hypothetical protein
MDEDFLFIEGFIRNKNTIDVIVSSTKLEDNNVHHAFICNWRDGDWDYWDEDFDVIKLCAYDGRGGPALIEMGMDGELMVGDSTGFRAEILDESSESPSRLRPLNDIRRIDNQIYVAGMRRQVFQRGLKDKTWQRCDAGVLLPKKSKEVAGFLSIDGFSSSEIYAVGYGGQIWRFDGAVWRQITSPTNVRLESIRCVNDEIAIVVGLDGLILRGRDDRWDVVEQDLADETLTDVEEARGSVYISTEAGALYELDGTNLTKIDTGLEGEITTGNLHSDGETLLSVGSRNLILFDGSDWTELPHPTLPPV